MKTKAWLLISAVGLVALAVGITVHFQRGVSKDSRSGISENHQTGIESPTKSSSNSAKAPDALQQNEVQTPRSSPASAAIRPIIGASGEAIPLRWQAVQSLNKDLNEDEIKSLQDYLRNHEASTNSAMRGVLKNEVVLALKAQQTPPANLASVLMEIFGDSSQDVVTRDYALQHLITWYERSSDHQAIQRTLWNALGETNSSIAGTALLGLHRLAQAEPQLEPQRIATSALSFIESEGTDELVRISAVQVCAERGVQDALSPVLAILNSRNSSVALRVSAIAAVGSLGGSDQVALLEGLRSDATSAIQPALDAALKKLKKRLQG